MMKTENINTARSTAILGLMTALLTTGKMVLSFIPNVEIVSFMILMFCVYFGKKTFFSVFAFVIIEGLLYGFNVYWLGYLYIWPLLCLAGCLMRKKSSMFSLTVLSTLFGLFYGFMFSFVYIFTGSPDPGIGFALTWWAAGIPYDIVHGIGNMAVMLCLYVPVSRVLNMVAGKRKL